MVIVVVRKVLAKGYLFYSSIFIVYWNQPLCMWTDISLSDTAGDFGDSPNFQGPCQVRRTTIAVGKGRLAQSPLTLLKREKRSRFQDRGERLGSNECGHKSFYDWRLLFAYVNLQVRSAASAIGAAPNTMNTASPGRRSHSRRRTNG
jgi:hypothetical protein